MEERESVLSRSSSVRLTPNSSNSSASFTFQGRGATPGYRGVSTGGSLLQERLRERDAEKRRSIHFVDKGVQSSPVRSFHSRDDRRPSSSGIGVKGMGVKQWEEQTSTLHKQNYNLKLELFHRRDRQSKLEAELAAAQKIIHEQAEYQEMNDMIMMELERRDQAVDEAINLITSLEEQVELLRQENLRLRNGGIDSKTFDDEYNSLSSRIHQRNNSQLQIEQQTLSPRPLPRIPSFLSDHSEGTEALRSLYTKCTGVSESNLSKLDEEEDEEDTQDRIDSPRLSVLSRLSESSFVSVYGDKFAHEEQLDDEEESRQIQSSVLDWVENAPDPKISTSRKSSAQNDQYGSLDNVIKLNSEKRFSQISKNLIVDTQRPKNRPEYKERHALPPTPDTCRTGNLRIDSHNSIEALEQQNKAFARYFSCPSRTSLPLRPQSACETITSRRFGYGWDTPTETETGSIINTEDDDACVEARPSRIKTPTLFSFNENDWERDTSYSHEHILSQQFRLHQASTSKNTSSEEVSPKDLMTTKSEASPENSDNSLILDHKTSLSNRQTQGTIEFTETPNNAQNSIVNPSPAWRRNPISLTLARFRRNDQSSPNTQQLTIKPKFAIKNHLTGIERQATPPPIPRHREVTPSYRPSSVGSGKIPRQDTVRDVIQEKREERQRRVSVCGTGIIPSKEVQFADCEREEEDSSGKGVRKWLGLGVGSLRRG
ncbi:hypothetical protein K3495_g604 [Podosphaera aphanis]|nr:hypothetical protein K3495_g604 [Podosphaera aphanis]